MRRTAMAVLVTTLVASSLAHADAQCDEIRASAVRDSLAAITKLDDAIPQVPPEEDSYISKEESGALKSFDAQRLQGLNSRPYYSVWQLRQALNNLRDFLTDIGRRPPHEAMAAHQIKQAAQSMLKAEVVMDRFDNYVSKGGRLPNNDFASYYNPLNLVSPTMERYISCTVDAAHIADPR